MDKETLSNYGWIVVLVLILAVMMALASPFGLFVSDAIKDVAGGFWDVNSASLNAAGINAGNVGFSAECSVNGHYENDGKGPHGIATTDCPAGHTYTCECDGWVVPDGGKYYIGVTSTKLGDYTGATKVFNAGEKLPCGYIAETGDTYVNKDYEYRYNYKYVYAWAKNTEQNGWGVRVLDTSKSSYEEIYEHIANKPITTMYFTFTSCTSLTTAPIIPNSVKTMETTFDSCTSLTTAPIIPNSVTNMFATFRNCTSLTGTVEIKSNPTSYDYCFKNVEFISQGITLTGTSTILDKIGATGTNYCATCNGKCLNNH